MPPTTVAGAEKGLLGRILDAPVPTCFGKADKERLGAAPQAPARCQRGAPSAPSPRRPGASTGRWHVRAGSGSPCPGREAACSCRQGCCLPRGYSGEIPSLEGEPRLSCPSFPTPGRWIGARGFEGNVFKSPPWFPISQRLANWEGVVLTCLLTGSRESSSAGPADVAYAKCQHL